MPAAPTAVESKGAESSSSGGKAADKPPPSNEDKPPPSIETADAAAALPAKEGAQEGTAAPAPAPAAPDAGGLGLPNCVELLPGTFNLHWEASGQGHEAV